MMRNLLLLAVFNTVMLFFNQPIKAQDEALKLVKSFLNDLDKQDFKSAYHRIAVPSWGDFRNFSSPSSFGGIKAINLFEIKVENDIDSLTGIYVDAEYFDPTNGNARYKEKFYIGKSGEELKIVKFKLRWCDFRNNSFKPVSSLTVKH